MQKIATSKHKKNSTRASALLSRVTSTLSPKINLKNYRFEGDRTTHAVSDNMKNQIIAERKRGRRLKYNLIQETNLLDETN